jgi:hypothetical protein
MQPMMTSQRSGEVRWEWIGDAWKLFAANPGAWIGMQLLYLTAIILIIGLPVMLVMIPAGVFASRNDPSAAIAASGLLFLLTPVILLAALFAGGYLASGIFRAAIRQAQGQEISVGDLFSGGDCFLRVIGLVVVSILIQMTALVILLIPSFLISGMETLASLGSYVVGFTVNGLFFFAIPLIVDRGASVMDAIRGSIEVTKSQWWMFALFVLVVSILSGIGAFACLFGVLVTFPFYFTVAAVAYRDTFGMQGAKPFDHYAAPPPPSYYAPQPQFSAPPQPQFSAPPQPQFSAPPPQPPFSAPPPEPTPLHSQETQMIGKTCPTCAAVITRAANFCNQCGGGL